MRRVLLARLGQGAIVIALVVTIGFVLIRLMPGDPFVAALDNEGVAPQLRDQLRAQYGFDRPLPEQFLRFIGQLLRGDLGWSFSRSQRVAAVLGDVLPATALLMGTALLLGGIGGVLVGAWQGWRGDTSGTRWVSRASLLLLSVPEFVLALLFVLGPALLLGWFPVAGMQSDFAGSGLAALRDLLHHLVLPAGTLALLIGAVVARHQRRAVLGVADAEFVRAARAKGVPESRVLFRHALRNALVPVFTLAGVVFPALVSGAVLVERVFAWPGMGRAIVEAVLRRDYPLVVGAVMVSSLFVVLGTMLADLAVAWADPRQRRA